jgi:hypothetical protein
MDLKQQIIILRKERDKWQKKIWYLDNKIKVKNQKKEYNKNNKEKVKQLRKVTSRRDYEKHKERKIKYQKEYYKKNKETIDSYKKVYGQTYEGKKRSTKNSWRRYGLNMENFDEIYERYLKTTNCDNCNILLTQSRFATSTTRCMDHDHTTGIFRNILCQACNVKRK